MLAGQIVGLLSASESLAAIFRSKEVALGGRVVLSRQNRSHEIVDDFGEASDRRARAAPTAAPEQRRGRQIGHFLDGPAAQYHELNSLSSSTLERGPLASVAGRAVRGRMQGL